MSEGDFEKQLRRLQKIVAQLEAGDLPLEKGVALFKEGVILARSCRQSLEAARHEVLLVSQGIIREFEGGGAASGGDGREEGSDD